MENPYQGQLNYSHNYEDEEETHQRKPHKGYQGTPGEKESYEHHHHQRNSNEGSADVYTESHQGTQEDDESHDLRRKGELNNAIFIKLQEISRYNVEIGNYEEGLVNYDRCIEHLLRTLPEGPSSAIFQEFLYTTVKSLNEVALKLLQEGKLKDSLLLLERCRKMTHPNSFGSYPTLRSLTYNHLGCCYRRIGKLDKALYYLEKAWEFIQGIEKVDTSGITHINLCAVLSQLGDHRKALDHAKMAVSDCAYDLIEATKKNSIEDNHSDVNKKATMLAIAYHNLATEEEACKNPEAALQAYLRAFNLISEHNHPQHELCMKFGRAYEEARARMAKPGQRRTMSPGSQQRKYGKSPPPNITVKRPPSLNTANKAAKAYLQNNKVVIPRRKAPPINQTRPMTSHGVSPNNNPLNNQKLYVPMASMPQKRNERPVTAHPQSRTQHYQIHGVNEAPQNQNGRPGTGTGRREREAEQNRPSESELGSDVERFGLDEEDIEQADLKSNRLAFLQSLNQYNTQSNVSKGSDAPQRGNFLSEEHQGEERHPPPPAKASKKRGNQEPDPAKVHAAALKLQSFCRGHLARQEVARVMAEVPQPVFLILIAETMKGNLENGPVTKETLYYFLMMYELHSQIIHIHIKNLENKKFHKALVEYQVVNRTSKEAIIDELREACEKLIQHLEIHHDQIVFRDELGAEEEAIPEDVYMMGQDLARRDPENVITEITERTDERTDESEGKIAGSEDVNSNENIRFSHNEEKPVEEEEVVDEIAEEDNKYGEEVFEAEPQQVPKEKEAPQEEEINFDEEDQIEVDQEEEEERAHEPIVDTKEVAGLVGLHLLGGKEKDKKTEESIVKIQRNIRGKLARDKYKLFKNKKFKVVYSRCLSVQGNILGFRLVEGPSFQDQYGLFCYDFTKSKQFEAIEIPKHLVDLPNLTVQELRSMLNIDLATLRVHLKPEFKEKKPHHHHEETPREKSESGSSRKQPPQEMASERKSSRRDHDDHEETLASVPLYFGNEKIDSTIHYNKKADKILVRHGSDKKLEIPVSELEIDAEFSKPHFVNNMDIILLSRLSYRNGALIYDKSPHAQIPPSKQEEKPHHQEEALPDLEDPEVLQATSVIQKAYRKKQNQAKEQKSQPKETEDTKHPEKPNKEEEEEGETIEERGSHQKKLTVPNNRYSQKTLDEPEVSSPGLKDSAARFDSNRSANLFVNQESEELFNSGKNEQIRSINTDAPNEFGHFRGEQIEEGTESKRQKTTKKDDSLPGLNDPEVQGATLKIQNAYKKKQKKKEEVEKPKEIHHKEKEKEELPNLEDPEVQNASLKIQKAYLKKKNKKAQQEEKPKEPEKIKNTKKEEQEEELPNLEDPEVQNASLKIQKAYLKKKNKKAQQEEKPKEQEKPKEIKPIKKEEQEEELPNLEDPEVQNASLKIQKAYLKKKDRQNKKAQQEEKPKGPEKPKEPEEIKHPKKEQEEEELPNLEDPDVQNASLKIQKAYLKKKDRQNKKAQQEKPKESEEIKQSKKEQEEEELPNLEDPEVQNASLKIQKAYLKKKNNQKAQNVVQKPTVPEKKEEEAYDAYEDEFEKESPSPVKEQKQEAKPQPVTTHHAEPEFGLKEVGDEFDVFDKEEKKQAEALKRPGTAKVEKQTKEVKPQHTDEDFEPLDEDF